MKKLSNAKAELKKSVAYKKKRVIIILRSVHYFSSLLLNNTTTILDITYAHDIVLVHYY